MKKCKYCNGTGVWRDSAIYVLGKKMVNSKLIKCPYCFGRGTKLK